MKHILATIISVLVTQESAALTLSSQDQEASDLNACKEMAYEEFTGLIEDCEKEKTLMFTLKKCITDNLESLQQKLDDCDTDSSKSTTIATECEAAIAKKYEDDEALCEDLTGTKRTDCISKVEDHRTVHEPIYQTLCTCAKTAVFDRDESLETCNGNDSATEKRTCQRETWDTFKKNTSKCAQPCLTQTRTTRDDAIDACNDANGTDAETTECKQEAWSTFNVQRRVCWRLHKDKDE